MTLPRTDVRFPVLCFMIDFFQKLCVYERWVTKNVGLLLGKGIRRTNQEKMFPGLDSNRWRFQRAAALSVFHAATFDVSGISFSILSTDLRLFSVDNFSPSFCALRKRREFLGQLSDCQHQEDRALRNELIFNHLSERKLVWVCRSSQRHRYTTRMKLCQDLWGGKFLTHGNPTPRNGILWRSTLSDDRRTTLPRNLSMRVREGWLGA